MISLLRRIRRELLTEKRFGRYLLYAIGEIILVVIGILIALQINNWNSNRLKRLAEIKSYENIKRQLNDDLAEIRNVYEFNQQSARQIKLGVKIIGAKDYSKIDTLAGITMGLSWYSNFFGSGNIYETLVNSGDLKLLRNHEIPSKLQKLEMTYTFINHLEEQNWDILMQELSPEIRGVIDYSTFQPVKPEKLYSVELKNLFIEFTYLTSIKDTIYSRAMHEINYIIEVIDEELETDI